MNFMSGPKFFGDADKREIGGRRSAAAKIEHEVCGGFRGNPRRRCNKGLNN
jgi:hypothetical protein